MVARSLKDTRMNALQRKRGEEPNIMIRLIASGRMVFGMLAAVAPPSLTRPGGRMLRGGLRIAAATVIAAGGALLLAVLMRDMQLYTVRSGSMEPALLTGSVVAVNPAQRYSEPYQAGDIITFRVPSGMLITHRVVGVRHEDELVFYRTKGDANTSPDMLEVVHQHVVGKALVAVPFLGYFLAALRTSTGFVLFILLPATLVVLHERKAMRAALRKFRSSRFVPAGAFGAGVLVAGVTMLASGLFSDTVATGPTTITVGETEPSPSPSAEPSPSPTPITEPSPSPTPTFSPADVSVWRDPGYDPE